MLQPEVAVKLGQLWKSARNKSGLEPFFRVELRLSLSSYILNTRGCCPLVAMTGKTAQGCTAIGNLVLEPGHFLFPMPSD